MNDPATCPHMYRVRVTWVLADDPAQAVCLGMDETLEVRAESAADAAADAVDAAEYAGHCAGIDPARYRPVADVLEEGSPSPAP